MHLNMAVDAFSDHNVWMENLFKPVQVGAEEQWLPLQFLIYFSGHL